MTIPTYKQNPAFWNTVAQKHNQALFTIKKMMQEGCPWCHAIKGSFIDMAVHIETTHGFPHEALVETLKGLDT